MVQSTKRSRLSVPKNRTMRYNNLIKQSRVAPERAATLAALTATLRESALESDAMSAKFYYLQSSAHNMVTLALRHGDLVRPKSCQLCNNPSNKINAHHKDYSKPFDIIWLCYSCHRKQHPESYAEITGSKETVKMNRTIAWLREHPEHLNTASRELSGVIGVSHTTVNKAQRMLRGQSDSASPP